MLTSLTIMLAPRKTVSYEGRIIMHTQMYLLARRRLRISSLMVVGTYPCASVHLSSISSSDAGGWTGDGITLPGAIDLEGIISNRLISECVLTARLMF